MKRWIASLKRLIRYHPGHVACPRAPTIRVGVFVPREPRLHCRVINAFFKGLRRHGMRCFMSDLSGGWTPCEVSVTFGVYKSVLERGRQVGSIMAAQTQHGGRHLVLERGFLDRERYFMAGWNGLNGRADFRNSQMPPDRWNRLKIPLCPWRDDGAHVVVCGQVPWDASVQHIDMAAWCRETIDEIRRRTDRPIVFRPHPAQPQAIELDEGGICISRHRSFREDLHRAWCVVTFNSNSAVEAAVDGIPVFVADAGSMARPIANESLEVIERPRMPDRGQWLYDLAYSQWTAREMARGLAWEHLVRQPR